MRDSLYITRQEGFLDSFFTIHVERFTFHDFLLRPCCQTSVPVANPRAIARMQNSKGKMKPGRKLFILHFAFYIVLVADHFDEHSFTAAAVELSVENLLPRAEV